MIQNMSTPMTTTEFLLTHCAAYPALQPQDLLKALHQSVFGCGHFVTDKAFPLLLEELTALTDGPDMEPLDGRFCRAHLRMLSKLGLTPETLFRLFLLSAEKSYGSIAALESKLETLLMLARAGQIPFSESALSSAIEAWRSTGFPACHHSPEFRAAYHPAYRVIHKKYIHWLPLLTAIDQTMAEKGRAIVAIDGGSASGKTTLASLLTRIYDCNVFHMDDFFLQPHQRTPARLTEPGGNVDWERFYQEVLLPLTQNQPVRYRRYDCHAQTILPTAEIAPRALNIVEGAYSMHPALAEHYDLSVFLRVTPEVQRARILVRNDAETAERFFSMWIPMEQQYFNATDTSGRCDLILEVDT